MSEQQQEFQTTKHGVVQIKRWPGERALYALILIFSLGIWIAFLVSVIGIIYLLCFSAFFFVINLAWIAYLRGSAVLLGTEQFPDLYKRCSELSAKAGLKVMPEVYLTQADGALNAFATKFLRSHIVVLYSELIDACGENHKAVDMIIGHELGHIKAGHLRWMWFDLVGMWVPFLGASYSRAREYTCDRYGAALCGDRQAAILGLTILAAGPKLAPKVNLNAYVNQRAQVNTGLMTIGQWLSSYPTLSERIFALDNSLGTSSVSRSRGRLKAAIILAAIILGPLALATLFQSQLKTVASWVDSLEDDDEEEESSDASVDPDAEEAAEDVELPKTEVTIDIDAATEKVKADLLVLAAFVEEVRAKTAQLPVSEQQALTILWKTYLPQQEEPLDPFDGYSYGYERTDTGYRLWSVGPDGEDSTEDDIELRGK